MEIKNGGKLKFRVKNEPTKQARPSNIEMQNFLGSISQPARDGSEDSI
jgi:hypothetical protein